MKAAVPGRWLQDLRHRSWEEEVVVVVGEKNGCLSRVGVRGWGGWWPAQAATGRLTPGHCEKEPFCATPGGGIMKSIKGRAASKVRAEQAAAAAAAG